MVRVRAAVNLAGLRYGERATVDADDPYIAGLLRTGLLRLDGAAAPDRVDEPSPGEHSEAASDGP